MIFMYLNQINLKIINDIFIFYTYTFVHILINLSNIYVLK